MSGASFLSPISHGMMGEEFFRVAARIKIETAVHTYPLIAANQALNDLREGRFAGAAVLIAAC